MDTPQIYVACLAAYNNGFLHGQWISALQDIDKIYKDIYIMLAKSPITNAEEWAIHGYSGFGNARIEEYESIENVVNIAEFISKYGELGASLLEEYVIEDAVVLLEDHYHGAYDNPVDFAYSIFEECYPNAIPDAKILLENHYLELMTVRCEPYIGASLTNYFTNNIYYAPSPKLP